jgi:hypothetical protein
MVGKHKEISTILMRKYGYEKMVSLENCSIYFVDRTPSFSYGELLE